MDQTSLCRHYLSSQAVASQVFSAQVSLTAVFGMGTGGPSLQSTPTSRVVSYAIISTSFPVKIFASPLKCSHSRGVVHLQGLEPWTP